MEQSQEWLSEREIIGWWEGRRLRFNFYVGIVGVISWLLVWIAGSAAVKPGVHFEEPIVMISGPLYTELSRIYAIPSENSLTRSIAGCLGGDCIRPEWSSLLF